MTLLLSTKTWKQLSLTSELQSGPGEEKCGETVKVALYIMLDRSHEQGSIMGISAKKHVTQIGNCDEISRSDPREV